MAAPEQRVPVVVQLPTPELGRDAMPVVMAGNTPLGYGTLSEDGRSVGITTDKPVKQDELRVVWSGGSLPNRSAAARPAPAAGPPRNEPAPNLVPLTASDPGAPGPAAIARTQYTLGDTAFTTPSGHRVEITGEVTYPVDLGATKRPVAVLLHGRHGSCGNAQGKWNIKWPCPAGFQRIPNEQGYRPLADLLAGHGIVVVSIAANGIPGYDNGLRDLGQPDRGALVLRHLELWRGWAGSDTGGPFGGTFHERLDFGNVGLMGHSRGGEGIVQAAQQNARRPVADRFGITALVPLAATDFLRANPRGTASLSVVPYCDGDVAGLEGVHYYDDATTTADTVPHALLGVMGANHNFFNTVWTPGGWEAGTLDDGATYAAERCDRPGRWLTPEQQLGAGNAYVGGFLRARLLGQSEYDTLFSGNTASPPSAKTAGVVASFTAPNRLVINDQADLGKNALGGEVTAAGFTAQQACGGKPGAPIRCFGEESAEPHVTSQWDGPFPSLPQVRLAWDKPGAAWSNAIPAGTKLSGFQALRIRLTHEAWNSAAGLPGLSVSVRDFTGNTASTPLSGPALRLPPGDADSWGNPPALVTAITVPLSAFAGVDPERLRTITITATSQTGNITVADLSLT
ncbi:hypothetical protein D5S17_02380 [Pseudonocardiaceae bacterium YIM PH 21723]|nr:hypothetical protein D5S17_02380 [Pseudonocardiaceae bacterium YIM PH 21723]